ncbi:PhoD-like phosphatase N-terminal domain-containing protein [Dactylosporangium sp. NPDC000521]|uniref:PhoD-like phosphatase N-terminal domain-containing protein n=1 Tax=Dactylosporangium sp. NPDC000521 TaxID=3363975 RepID=UPI003688A1C0
MTPTPSATPGSGAGPPVAVTWQIAAGPGFAGVVAEGTVTTGSERDHTVKVDARGLAPATTYHYRFGAAGLWSPAGRTRTSPAADADLALLRFGAGSCGNWETGYFASAWPTTASGTRGTGPTPTHRPLVACHGWSSSSRPITCNACSTSGSPSAIASA